MTDNMESILREFGFSQNKHSAYEIRITDSEDGEDCTTWEIVEDTDNVGRPVILVMPDGMMDEAVHLSTFIEMFGE